MADIYKTDLAVERELDRLKDWNIPTTNDEKIREFIGKMRTCGMSEVQLLKYLQGLKFFSQTCNKEFSKVTKKDLDLFMASMDSKSLKTKKIGYYSLKKFFDNNNQKKLFKDYSFKFNGLKKKKLPDGMLTIEEIEKMINACNQTSNNSFVVLRNQAIIGVLYESGCRISEFLNLKIKDLKFDDSGCRLRVSGKTGDRESPRTINYTTILQNYLNLHPEKNNPEAFVWIKENGQRIGYDGVNEILKEIKKRAEITKKIHPHIFRHSRATHLAKFLTEQELKVYFGWSGASEMAGIYVHLSGEDVDNKVLKSAGIEHNGHQNPISSPKFCPQCNGLNSSLQQFCKNCGSNLDKTEAVKMEKFETVMIKFFKVIGEVFPQSREELKKIMREENLTISRD